MTSAESGTWVGYFPLSDMNFNESNPAIFNNRNDICMNGLIPGNDSLFYFSERSLYEGVWEQVLQRILEPKRKEGRWGWKSLHNEEIHILYASQNIIRVIKLRRMRWAGHEAWMGELRKAYKISIEKLEERDHLEDVGTDVNIILKWILMK